MDIQKMYARVAATALLAIIAPLSANAALIPNGNFGTGDFTDWTPGTNNLNGGTSSYSVQFLDGAYRAVFTASAGPEAGLPPFASAGMTTQSDFTLTAPTTFEFDASYSYSTTDPNPGVVAFTVAITGVTASPPSVFDHQPIQFSDPGAGSGSIPTTTFTLSMPAGTYDIAASVDAQSFTSGTSTGTLIVTNFRTIPEPATVVLAGMGLAGLFFFARRARALKLS